MTTTTIFVTTTATAMISVGDSETAPAKRNDQHRSILRGCSVSEAKEEQKTLLTAEAKQQQRGVAAKQR